MDHQNRQQHEKMTDMQVAIDNITNAYKKGKRNSQQQLNVLEHKLDLLLSATGQQNKSQDNRLTNGGGNNSAGNFNQSIVNDGSRAEAANALRATGFIPGTGVNVRGKSVFKEF